MADRSWGPGWPNCQTSKVNKNFHVDTKWGRTYFPGGLRQELVELATRLVKETANRGYRFGIPGNPSYGCWGFACRPVRGSKTKASEHSFATTLDINAPKNPMSSKLITDMPGWMPDLWNAYGFRWGGDYKTRPDAMHYEFMGSVNDCIRLTAVARSNRLGENRAVAPKPQPKPEPTPTKKDGKMYFLIKGDKSSEWWLTDMMTKRHIEAKGAGEKHSDRDFFIYAIRANGGTVIDDGKGGPQIWEQEKVNDIPVLPNPTAKVS